ncbi:MAG: TIR domain-containing protein [Desulfobaccales bacterium]
MTESRHLIFISYSHKDEAWKDRLVTHLNVLQYQESLEIWNDRRIEAGEDWFEKIETALNASSIALLLISANFLTSKFITEEEVPRLLQRRAQEGLRLIPVILEPCAWQTVRWISQHQARPKDGRPLSGGTPHQINTDLTAITLEIDSILHNVGQPQTPASFIPLPPDKIYLSRLPITSSDLFGRESELALLDAAWENPRIKIICLLASGGVGKTALVKKWLQRLNRDYFRGAEMAFAESFYSQGAKEGGQVSADPFMAKALEWFGDPDPAKGSAWDKGVRLAELIREQRTLLILDGLEPLQYPPGPMGGRLKDPALASLLRELAYHNPGLCIITSRLPVEDLADFSSDAADPEDTATVLSHDLNLLSPEAGAQLLERLGVQGLPGELEQAARDFQGNALALTLLGRFLARGYAGDIRRRHEVEILKETKHGGHTQRVMAAYAQWFADQPELNILYLLGLFDRPTLADVLEALKAPPLIPGLTSELQGLSPADWQEALANLRDARLLAPADPDQPDILDCHPLIREYFGGRLKEENSEAWREGHSRLYEYYKTQAPEFPETLEAMLPLYAAVAHGCQAGRHQEALEDVYWPRIHRKNEGFDIHKLGAFGADLAALTGFFDLPWLRPILGLSEIFKGFVLNVAAMCLQALGRLAEAVQPLQASLETVIAQGDLRNAAQVDANLTDLSVALGWISQARNYIRHGIDLANLGTDEYLKLTCQAYLANVLFKQGLLIQSKKLFHQAEKMQQKRLSTYPFLDSLAGFMYCELLLSLGQYPEVLERAGKTIEWARMDGVPFNIALDHLSLGQAYLMQAMEERSPDLTQAAAHLDQSLTALRQAGREDFIVLGLLARAGLYRVQNDWPRAHRDLHESMARAKRSGMALHQADAHLEYTRLYLAQSQPEKARPHLTTAKKMIAEIGYGLRHQDVLDLEAQLRRTH